MRQYHGKHGVYSSLASKNVEGESFMVKTQSRLVAPLSCAVVLFCSIFGWVPSANALVVESTTGAGAPPSGFTFTDNVPTHGSAGSVYLGNGYVLAARHPSGGAKFAVELNNVVYNPTADPAVFLNNTLVALTFGGTWSTYADLMVFRLAGVPSSIPGITLATAPVTTGETIDMTGLGRTRVASTSTYFNGVDYNDYYGGGSVSETGYNWSGSNQFIQWGQNKVSPSLFKIPDSGYGDTLSFSTQFNSPGNGDALPDEAMGAAGDSGAPAFIKRGGQWDLTGINLTVDLLLKGSPPAPPSSALFAAVYSSANADMRTYMANLYYYQDQYAMLIPEPASFALLMGGMAAVLSRRRSR